MTPTEQPIRQEKIDEINEVIARFDGWEEWEPGKGEWFKRATYSGERFVQSHELKYHSSWSELHSAWNKLYGQCRILKPLDPVRRSFYLLYCKPMAAAMYCGSITEAHRILYDGIIWLNKQNDNGKNH